MHIDTLELPETTTRIRWDSKERELILKIAVDLKRTISSLTNLQLILEAQKALPENRRRDLKTISGPSFIWFVKGLESVPTESEIREAQPQISSIEISNFTLPEEEEFSSLQAEILKSILQVLTDGEKRDQELKLKVLELENKIEDLTTQLEKWTTQGFSITLTPNTNKSAVPVTQNTNGNLNLSTSLPPPKKENIVFSSPPPVVSTRKAKIVILSLESGHVRNGIKNGVNGQFAQIDFWDVPKKSISFANYDYIICTKKTSLDWVTEVKQALGSRLKVIPGNADRIIAGLKELPEVKICPQL